MTPREAPATIPVGWTGEGAILFGGSGFLGPSILGRFPEMISVGRTRPVTANRHIQVPTLDDLSPLDDLTFDKVIFIIGHTDHHALERDRLPRGEPNAFDYHLIPLVRVMEQLKHRPLTKFLHCSSILIYDDTALTLPVDEHAPIDPYKNRYVLSKYLAEEACRFYAQWVPIVNVRFSNLYGPTPLQRYDLIHVLCRTLMAAGRAEIWTRQPRRDFIYMTDAADAFAKLLFAGYTGTLNLGTGTMTSVGHVVDVLQAVSGCPITSQERPVSGPMQFVCDLTTLQAAIDWRPEVTIDDGVRRCWEFAKTAYPTGRTR